jgi:DNA-binding NtrC family response regulator
MEFFAGNNVLGSQMEVFVLDQHVSVVVVVVDDEKVISNTLGAILKHHGFQASSFSSPYEALHHMRLQPPDVLISDIIMPGLSGVELALLVRKLYPECKILLLSGQATTADVLRSAREQGHHFRLLAKPIHPTALLAEIKKL